MNTRPSVNPILFCSYFTLNTPYEEQAKRLKNSLNRLNLDHYVEGLPGKNSWVENCAQKASFVKSVREQSDRPICWLDADAVVIKRPETLMAFKSDFGVLAWDGWQFSGGQILFGTSKKARILVRRWEEYSTAFPKIWDQVTLAYAWWDTELAVGLETEWLPETLIVKRKGNWLSKIRQRLFNRKSEIFHWQASRENLTKHDADPVIFSDSDLPQWWREAVADQKIFELSDIQKRELGILENEG